MKCASAIRQMAYGAVPDALDEYQQMGATTTRKALQIFCKTIMELYGEEFLRKPTYTDIYCSPNDESAKINEQANNLNNDEVENASEVVSDTYFGDNGEVQGFEHQHDLNFPGQLKQEFSKDTRLTLLLQLSHLFHADDAVKGKHSFLERSWIDDNLLNLSFPRAVALE
ncbi:hypothetical protein Tco_0508741 [Tanacetum coccineum]